MADTALVKNNSTSWRSGELIIVLMVVLILTMFFIPLPTFFLDVFLTLNISAAFLVLLLTMNVRRSLEFSVFPSMLLVATLFRLALNVSSTRLILLKGDAGNVIHAFGRLVAGSNPVVGFVIFIILTVIQFLVITKGSERVAEVAARFTLDAMPGKQMSIDADLNAGLINEEQARTRRREVEREADFYGAMDGASKFVKGDAIAGILITVINLIGGMVIGVLQMGLPFGEAVQRFSLLTVGDGLVSQVPALLISTATGILVTRSASESDLGSDLSRQFTAYPRAVAVAAVGIGMFGLIPGMPNFAFLSISALLGFLAYTLRNMVVAQEQQVVEETPADGARRPENVLSLISVDPMELEIGYSLIPLVDKSQGGDLFERVGLIRRQAALELGMILPPIRIRDNMQLPPSKYLIKIKGVDIAQGELMTNHYLAMDAGAVAETVEGIATTEPAFGLPALWIPESRREQAEMFGYTVVDPPSVLATHLTEVIRSHAHELLGRQEVQALVDHIKSEYSVVVEELIPGLLTIGEVQKVLASLLREGIPIRNLVTILENLADYAPLTKDPLMLTEYVRAGLARQISKQFAGEDGVLRVLTLDPRAEDELLRTQEGQAVDPQWLNRLYASLQKKVGEATQEGYNPTLLCSPTVRRVFRSIVERVAPRLAVLSYQEVIPELEVHSLGVVGVEE
jgi:flagellar biosynthesis protein FlhA